MRSPATRGLEPCSTCGPGTSEDPAVSEAWTGVGQPHSPTCSKCAKTTAGAAGQRQGGRTSTPAASYSSMCSGGGSGSLMTCGKCTVQQREVRGRQNQQLSHTGRGRPAACKRAATAGLEMPVGLCPHLQRAPLGVSRPAEYVKRLFGNLVLQACVERGSCVWGRETWPARPHPEPQAAPQDKLPSRSGWLLLCRADGAGTWGSLGSSVQPSRTTPGAAKQAKLSMWPLVSSSPTRPRGSQMIFCRSGSEGAGRARAAWRDWRGVARPPQR